MAVVLIEHLPAPRAPRPCPSWIRSVGVCANFLGWCACGLGTFPLDVLSLSGSLRFGREKVLVVMCEFRGWVVKMVFGVNCGFFVWCARF